MKALVTPRSFGKNNPALFDILRQAGLEVVRNPGPGILDADRMKALMADCAGVIVGVDPVSADAIASAPNLRAIAKYGVGVDNIDLDACAKRGIAVSRTVGANSAAVADYAFALMLALSRRIIPIDRACRGGDWGKITTTDVSEKKLGLVGLGAIGREMAARARGFSMQILACDMVWDDAYAAANGIRRSETDDICRECDFISLHLPLNDQTRNAIDARRLAMMKPSAFLINTARGGLIDEGALLDALKGGRIAGAGIDAFSEEPPSNREWFGLDNLVIGSHCAASTEGAANRMGLQAAENLIRDLGLAQPRR